MIVIFSAKFFKGNDALEAIATHLEDQSVEGEGHTATGARAATIRGAIKLAATEGVDFLAFDRVEAIELGLFGKE